MIASLIARLVQNCDASVNREELLRDVQEALEDFSYGVCSGNAEEIAVAAGWTMSDNVSQQTPAAAAKAFMAKLDSSTLTLGTKTLVHKVMLNIYAEYMSPKEVAPEGPACKSSVLRLDTAQTFG